MAYRQDADLAFLEEVPSDDLHYLVEILTKREEGGSRVTEELTQSQEYLLHSPDHHKYWELIAAEIQCFGANTFMTMFRGEGVLYEEVLQDVCDKMDVNYNKNASVQSIEMNLLMKVLENSMAEMSPSELKKVCKDLDLKTTTYTSEAVVVALQTAIRMGGFAPYKVAVIVANAVVKTLIGRGLSIAANVTLTRVMGIFAGPVGWILTAGWTLIDIAGPAYRVTIPAVIMIAYLRTAVQTGNLEKRKADETVMDADSENDEVGRKLREAMEAAEARVDAAKKRLEAAGVKLEAAEAKRDAARAKLEAAKGANSPVDLQTARTVFEVAQAKLEATEAKQDAIKARWSAASTDFWTAAQVLNVHIVEETKRTIDRHNKFMAQDGGRQLEERFGNPDEPWKPITLDSDDDEEELFPPDTPAKTAAEAKYDAASKKAGKVYRKLRAVKADPDAIQADIDAAQAKYDAAAKKRERARKKWVDTP